jgi:hypothetical protein
MTAMDDGGGRWDGWLGPRTWVPALAVLLIAVAALAALFVRERGNASDNGASRSVPVLATTGDLRQKTHTHADFAVFINGQKRDFSDPDFVSKAGDERSANVHLHKPRFSVIHVHRTGTTFDEFFRSIGWELTDTCIKPAGEQQFCNSGDQAIKFMVNGVRVDSLMFEDIPAMGRVLISYGTETDDQLLQQYGQVTDESCILSGLCLARGDGAGEQGEPEECSSADNTCD